MHALLLELLSPEAPGSGTKTATQLSLLEVASEAHFSSRYGSHNVMPSWSPKSL